MPPRRKIVDDEEVAQGPAPVAGRGRGVQKAPAGGPAGPKAAPRAAPKAVVPVAAPAVAAPPVALPAGDPEISPIWTPDEEKELKRRLDSGFVNPASIQKYIRTKSSQMIQQRIQQIGFRKEVEENGNATFSLWA